MKQVFISGAGQVNVFDVPIPDRLENSILVRNYYSLISSGTEGAAMTQHSGVLGIYEKAISSKKRLEKAWQLLQTNGIGKTKALIKNKLSDFTPLGYSSVGQVIEVDHDDLTFQPGDMVACMGTGFANHAEYISVPHNLAVKVPQNVNIKQASFAAIACIAMQGIRRAQLTPGENVAIIGLGLIGQIALRLLSAMGYRAYGLDISAERVALAKQANCEKAWNLHEIESTSFAKTLTQGQGFDGVIVCAATSSHSAVNLAFDLCRKSGCVSIVGDIGLSLERNKMYAKELDLYMSCSYGPGRYDPNYEIKGIDYPINHIRWSEGRNLEHFLWLLETKKLNLDSLISQCFSIDDATNAYACIKKGNANTLGVILDYGQPLPLFDMRASIKSHKTVRVNDTPPTVKQHKKNIIRLGIIGAGGYTKSVHLPNLLQLANDFTIANIVSRSGASATIAAHQFKIPQAGSDYRTILGDPSIDAVLISTRHALHAKIALDALKAHKHVFIEKPMTTTVEDATAIVDLAKQNKLIVRVGFNRRFSPYLNRLRTAIGSNGTRIFSARVNIGAINNDWSNTVEEGGRLLGEGVHFFDLANWFMNAEPISITATMAGVAEVVNPNASVILSYPDHSQAIIIYTNLGGKSLGKEYYETFGNGQSARLDDYHHFYSTKKMPKQKMKRGDKGQKDCLREFAAAIRGDTFPIIGANASAGLTATRIALDIIKLAKNQTQTHSQLDNIIANTIVEKELDLTT